MMTNKILMISLLAVMSLNSAAQSFNDDYQSVGVYDTWELSPFRTGQLNGNVQVIKNHLYSASGVNRTGHILGVQRSRFGSNTFGARVDLNSPVTIGRSGKYVHALVYSPVATEVQFIGLGKRTTNTWSETADVEQFWSEPVSITANKWTDIVAKVVTNENAEVYSIVVVPDCASPHTLSEDFIAYADEIVVNSSSSKRTSVSSTADPYVEDEGGGGDDPDPGTGGDDPDDPTTDEFYPLNFDKETTNSRYGDKHYMTYVKLTSSSNNVQAYPSASASAALGTVLYYDKTADAVFDVTAGQSYTPAVGYGSDWMQAYCYVDYDRDGQFTEQLTTHTSGSVTYYTLAEGSELVSYSAYSTNYTGGATGSWYDSNGTSKGNMEQGNYGCNTTTMPAFTVPSTLQSGYYRMRLKVDWNSLDAGGNDGSDGTDNSMLSNGGGIVDVLLHVTGGTDVDVYASELYNGQLYDDSGAQITGTKIKKPYNQPLTVQMSPASGFETVSLTAYSTCNSTQYPGMVVTGDAITYTTSGSEYDAEEDAFTLPAALLYSELKLVPLYGQKAIVYLTVSFNTDGGSEVESQTVAEGALAEQPADPTKEGYTFAGWYADEELTSEYDFSTPVTAATTIYAKWEKVVVKCATPTLEWTNGRVQASCETEGVTYVYNATMATNGTSADGRISLSGNVRFEVYATKDDCTDSDTATLEVTLPQVGDVNGDGSITIADVTALVDMILGK